MGSRESVVTDIATSGGEEAAAHFRTGLDVETKSSEIDPVTEADRSTQAVVLSAIEDRFPDDAIVAEEDDASKTLPEDGYAWIVDPIDGTLNYSRGMREWTTSVAVVDGNSTLASANVAPELDDTYTGTSSGTRLNGQAVSVSDRTDPASFLVASTLRLQTDDHRKIGVLADAVIERFGEFRRTGSAQLTLSLVASGSLDAVIGFDPQPEPWDTVGGVFQVRQAGGTVTDLDGNPWEPGRPGLVASNGKRHDAVVEVARRTLE